jgi:MFS family permease
MKEYMIDKSSNKSSAWILVFFCFLALAFSFSSRATLGLVMPIWVRDFGWSKSFISSVGALALVVMACVAPFAGRFVDRYGPRLTLAVGLLFVGLGAALIAMSNSQIVFIIGFGIVSAIGFGIVATHVVSTSVAHIFESNRGLAIGIATAGATAGQFVIVPIIAFMIDKINWKFSFYALAGASFLLIPILWKLINKSNTESGGKVISNKKHNLRSDISFLIRQPAFHILFWSFLFCGYTTTGIIETHLMPYTAFCGFPPLPSATAYGVLSIVNLLGMIGAGWLTDKVNRPLLLASIYFLRSATFLLLIHVGVDYEILILFAIAFGVVDYATVPVTASLAAEYLGIERMGLSMGIIAAGHAIGGAIGAYLGGYFFDKMNSYYQVWLSGICISMIAAAIVFALNWSKKQKLIFTT